MPVGRSFLCAVALALVGCFPPGDGLSPPEERLYFPVGLALDADAEHLYVVNSDFDLQFNQGVLQSYDLSRLRALVPRSCQDDGDCDASQRCDDSPTGANGETPSYFCVARTGADAGLPCGAVPESTASERLIAPGRCGAVNQVNPQNGGASLITSTVEIGAFATDVLYRARPEAAPAGPPGRLFVPVRGDTTLHWIDVFDDGDLECGQDSDHGRCDDKHRVGDDPEAENTRDLRLPPEPFGIAASEDGTSIVVSHQTQGKVSLFLNDWTTRDPRLEFVTTGLPSRPMDLAAVPVPRFVEAAGLNYQPGFLLTYRNARELSLLRFFEDGALSGEGPSPARPYLVHTASRAIQTNSLGVDSRGIAVDASARKSAEALCDEESDDVARTACWQEAARVPVDVFVSNRTPPSVILGRTQPENSEAGISDLPYFHATLPLTAGPSRVALGQVLNAEGEPETRVFVVCFDSRLVFIVDPVTDRIEAEIFTGRGPHPLVTDVEHGLGYLGHFTDSYIGVVALDQRFPRSYGTIVATIGKPVAPRATK